MLKELKDLRIKCLRYANGGKDGNLQSVFSSMEIIWALYHNVMDVKSIINGLPSRDVFILSKGQSSLGLLSVLSTVGIIQENEMEQFCKFDSRISMQIDRNKFPIGIENSAGSLGHGYPMAVGVALANKIKGNNSRVFCLAGDGEMHEGTMWEASFLATHKELDNLCLIVDNNHSLERMISKVKLSEKLTAFGFNCYNVNGHEVGQLTALLKGVHKRDWKPIAVIADTVRGYGSKTLMENNEWFHKYPSDSELIQIIYEVEQFEERDGSFCSLYDKTK